MRIRRANVQSRFCEKLSQNYIGDKRVEKNHAKTLDNSVIYRLTSLKPILDSAKQVYSNISTENLPSATTHKMRFSIMFRAYCDRYGRGIQY
jgi:hypothetical protein